jgi:hypothetical protein
MSTYSESQQRELDQQSGAEMDKRGIGAGRIGPTMVSIPLVEYQALKAQRDELAGLLREFTRGWDALDPERAIVPDNSLVGRTWAALAKVQP